MIAVAPCAIARFITSRTCIDASSTDPRHIALFAIRLFLALRNRTRIFDRRMRHRRVQIILQGIPAEKHRPSLQPRLQQPQSSRLGDLERRDHPFGLRVRGKEWTNSVELGDQRLRLCLCIPARDREREEVFDQFVVEQCLRTAFEKTLAKAGPMPRRVTQSVPHPV